MQGTNKAYNQGNMPGSAFRNRSSQGSNGNSSHHPRRNENRHSPDNNNTSHNNNNNGGARSERYSHGREMNGRNPHGGGHGGHGGGGGYGGRGTMPPREQTRPPPVQSSTQFDSRNHKEIVDFFQHNFDQIIKEQTLSGPEHKPSSTRKAIYYQPPQGLAPPPAVASEAGSY